MCANLLPYKHPCTGMHEAWVPATWWLVKLSVLRGIVSNNTNTSWCNRGVGKTFWFGEAQSTGHVQSYRVSMAQTENLGGICPPLVYMPMYNQHAQTLVDMHVTWQYIKKQLIPYKSIISDIHYHIHGIYGIVPCRVWQYIPVSSLFAVLTCAPIINRMQSSAFLRRRHQSFLARLSLHWHAVIVWSCCSYSRQRYTSSQYSY